MRIPWKLIGVAGLTGVAATGVVVTRRRRAHRDYDPDELRARLHERLASAGGPPTECGPSQSESPPAGQHPQQ